MPTKNPRVLTVLEPSLHEWLTETAAAMGISVSHLLRDIVAEAMEMAEDRYWSQEAEKRLATFDPETAIPIEDVWKHEKLSGSDSARSNRKGSIEGSSSCKEKDISDYRRKIVRSSRKVR